MNRQEAQAQWTAHKAAFEARGVVLPQVTMYTPDEWRADPSLAMDVSAGPLSTDPNSALPAMLTTTIDPEVIRAIFAPLQFAEILGERKYGDWLEETRMFPVVESTGEVSSYGDFNNNGRAGINLNWPQFQSYLFQIFQSYGERELARAGWARINYVSELGISAADLLNRYQNLTYAFGVQGLQNYGITNNPYLSASLTPAIKAAGGTTWFTAGDAPNATPNEVYAAGNAWYAAQVAGNTYMRLPLCTVAPAPCRTQAMTATVYADITKGNKLSQTVLADVYADVPVPLTLMQTLSAIITTLRSLPTASTGS
jgi:hypothetical protein